MIGKWHLGLGAEGGPDLNGEISPGPLDIGFDEAFLIPATGDRVPTVYIENRAVVGLDPADPIEVSFPGPVGDDPTGAQFPELLKMRPSHGHDRTIVNGISRIGHMSGGNAARWVDEDMADVITQKGVSFIENRDDRPFFLYFSTHDIHVPQNSRSTLSLRKGKWKFISPSNGRAYDSSTNIELGNDPSVQLYDLAADIGERQNVATEHPDIVEELSALLESVRTSGSR
ncbi:MAG: hypothetical protein ACI80V_002418 [Rhodothermales bacterium]